MNSNIVTIKKVVNGGYGFSQLGNGKVVLVERGLPGEVVEIKISHAQRSMEYASIGKIIEPNPSRMNPPCPYYPACGGCDLQHASYDYQLVLKQQILEDLLSRSQTPALEALATQLSPTLPSPQMFHYRQRIRLSIGKHKSLGFKRFKSHEVVSVKSCMLASDKMNHWFQTLTSHVSLPEVFPQATELEIVFDPKHQSVCGVIKLSKKPKRSELGKIQKLAEELGNVTRLFFTGDAFALMGPFGSDPEAENSLGFTTTLSHLKPLTFSWEVGGFCQVNLPQNRQLVELVLQWCEEVGEQSVLDLYCGFGNLSLPLAAMGYRVCGVESNGSSVRSAKQNIHRNALTGIEFFKSDVATACNSFLEQSRTFDTVICDPPRQGLNSIASTIAKLARFKIIYVSCDPATLCRDLAEFVSYGFHPTAIQPVDMFPQTHHIESAVCLERRN